MRSEAEQAADKVTPLKPCPSGCGGTASPFKFQSGLAEGSTIILCECGWRTSAFDNPAHAAEMWNTRTPSAAVEAAMTALRAMLTEAEFVGDAKAPFSTWVAEKCRAALAQVEQLRRPS